jgi:hypothetical protein
MALKISAHFSGKDTLGAFVDDLLRRGHRWSHGSPDEQAAKAVASVSGVRARQTMAISSPADSDTQRRNRARSFRYSPDAGRSGNDQESQLRRRGPKLRSAALRGFLRVCAATRRDNGRAIRAVAKARGGSTRFLRTSEGPHAKIDHGANHLSTWP